MLQAALADGTAQRRCVFEMFVRRLPHGRRYGVTCGTGRFLHALTNFRFDDDDLRYLSDNNIVNQQTIDWLSSFVFSGSIDGYQEGEVYFPASPVLTVEATFGEAVLLETLALSIFNHDSAVASAASRMTTAAKSRPCNEMGSRRTHEHAAVAAARAAYIAGFSATSNLGAGRLHGIPTMGTSAHAFTLLHDKEEGAFTSQVQSLGNNTTLLVDTFDVSQAVEHAVKVAGIELGAVRLDSGDLRQLAIAVRAQLDRLGAYETKIIATSDLDEHMIAALQAAPIDAFGVGTNLVTGSGHPTAGFVYKLVAREDGTGQMQEVRKQSLNKATVGGRKYATRALDKEGKAMAEVISTHPSANTSAIGDGRKLQVPLVRGGQPSVNSDISNARKHLQQSLCELPPDAHQLSPGDPAIPTRFA